MLCSIVLKVNGTYRGNPNVSFYMMLLINPVLILILKYYFKFAMVIHLRQQFTVQILHLP